MRSSTRGQALLLVILGLGIFLIGGIGLAVDGAQLYAQREMAQAAADAAAQAGIFSIYSGTGAAAHGSHTVGTAFNCTVTPTLDSATPCVYAQKNGFGLGTDDTVAVSFPSSPYNGVPGTSNARYPYPFEQVTITRTVHTTLMQFLGASTSTVKAIGGAGIVQVTSPIPILVLHPSNSSVISTGGDKSGITILGGPGRSIMVNSSSASAIGSATGFINLSGAGPTGTGGDFAINGPTPQPVGSKPVLTLCPALPPCTGNWVQPAAPMNDPFADPVVLEPTAPGNSPVKTPLANGVGGCPASPKKACNMYYPGSYPGSISITNETAVFEPGLYYINGNFSNGANGDIYPCQSVGGVTCVSAGLTGNTGTGSGVTFYLKGPGSFSMTANSDVGSAANPLTGSDPGSTYKGILFFSERDVAGTGVVSHTLGGGGNVYIVGTIYLTNKRTLITGPDYQILNLNGGSGSNTNVVGEIITDELTMGGNSAITMTLNPAAVIQIDQIALVK